MTEYIVKLKDYGTIKKGLISRSYHQTGSAWYTAKINIDEIDYYVDFMPGPANSFFISQACFKHPLEISTAVPADEKALVMTDKTLLKALFMLLCAPYHASFPLKAKYLPVKTEDPAAASMPAACLPTEAV